MSDRTPKRSTNPSNQGYSPITLPESPAAASPQRNLTGLPRVARDLIADIYNNIQRWNDNHIQGAGIIKQIIGVKQANPTVYSTDLEALTTVLLSVVANLRTIRDNLITFTHQMDALVKLNKQSTPLFISHSTESLADLVHAIVAAYEAEFQTKEFILENIAHCGSKNEAMFYGTLWTYQCRIVDNISFKLETLLLESGHRKFN